MNPEYILPTIIVLLEVVLIVWGIKSLLRWIRRVVDKQQEISMTKAQAMKTVAENEQKREDTQ